MNNIARNCLLFILISLEIICHAQSSDSVQRDFGYLHYSVKGKGSPVIILSGGPGNSAGQLNDIFRFLSRTHQAILLEQRGTGRSIILSPDNKNVNLKLALSDIDAVLNHLGINKVSLLGHSWGATLAMAYAAQHPSRVSSLILLGPGSYHNWRGMLETLNDNIRARMGVVDLQKIDSISIRNAVGKASAEDYALYRKTIRSTYVFNKLAFDTLVLRMDVPANPEIRSLMNADLFRNLDLSKSLPVYKGALHVITGRQDVLAFNSYEIKLLMPHTQIHWIEQSGHFPFFERENVFYDILQSVLDKL